MPETTPTEQPPAYVPAAPEPRPARARLGTAAVVLGILGILFAVIPPTNGFGIFLGVVAVVLGIIGIRRKGRRAVAGTVVGAVAVILGAMLAGVYSGSSDDSATDAAAATEVAAASPAAASEESKKVEKPKTPEKATADKPAEASGTVGQLQAAAAAKSYLDSGMGFSAASLLQQLTSSAGNGFAQADAQWAIDHSGADWNAQARAAAKGYLDSGMGFSEASLNGQLTSSAGNQFTPEQAQYAVAKAGADWNAQAVTAAEGYMSSGMGFSRASLIAQLTSSAGNQFTQPQAEYAATQVGLN
ncbi:Ltp family lipoprotein [Curtobacterium sp. MCBD17_026]|uniref:Ltp family lipoprotein n=1 Tax=Curtobacterium sp. MCBD17_026 TaxID=2175621 RepID=UPI000DA9AE5A|nr:Ltp family lipoprotein [Curtobacterium sp. MCBD17_026]WIB70999.1 Ltp family lipoprotein [Curtobacterium sp. MCBD17_026]